jgi:hypothetical protein
MGLREGLDTTRVDALAALGAAHDYFFYAKGAWRIYNKQSSGMG